MSLAYEDWKLLQDIRDIAQMGNKLLERIEKNSAASIKNETDLITAFNHVAESIENLAKEVHALRNDLTPNLDKTQLKKPKLFIKSDEVRSAPIPATPTGREGRWF